MTRPAVIGWRRALAALLVMVTALAGAGRAAASTVDPVDLIPGFHAPICHSGARGAADDPAAPTRHDCCDDCALVALAVLPAPPAVADPLAPAAAAEHGAFAAGPTTPARQRSPRQSQGPPRG